MEQAVQAEAPTLTAYVPAAQVTHASLELAPVAALAVPAGHEEQDAEPATAANVPAAHVEQAVEPALAEKLPAGQGTQAALELAPAPEAE